MGSFISIFKTVDNCFRTNKNQNNENNNLNLTIEDLESNHNDIALDKKQLFTQLKELENQLKIKEDLVKEKEQKILLEKKEISEERKKMELEFKNKESKLNNELIKKVSEKMEKDKINLEKEKDIIKKEKEDIKINKEYIEKERENIQKQKEKLEKEKLPILVGLDNIGATCYMNATLQSLSNTDKLTDYFLTKFKYEPQNQEKKISNEYYKLLTNLYDRTKMNKSYSPNDFKTILSKENPLFQGIQANDSKDLINFLIERLHKELNIKQVDNDNSNYNVNQLNENEVLQSFFQDFQNNFRSIISDLFYGVLETKTKCCGCQNIKYNFQVLQINFNF